MQTTAPTHVWRKLAQNNRLANRRLLRACQTLTQAEFIAPPQLDEFIVADDARFRKLDMALLGWTETDLMT